MADPAYIVDGVLTDGEAWVALNTTTLGSDTAVVTFRSGYNDAGADVGGVQAWDQYMDLVLIIYGRNDRADTGSAEGKMNFNNDTGGNYPYQDFRGNGSSASCSRSSAATYIPVGMFIRNNETANIFCASIVHMFDINSGKYKSSLVQYACEILDGSGYDYAGLTSTTWKSQAPITEIDLTVPYGDWLTASSFSLFGVLPRMVA